MNGTASNTSGASEVKLRFKPQTDQDRIPQVVIDELSRRGYGIAEESNQGAATVLLQPTEPEDKTKVWWQTDLSGVPIGLPLTYSTTQSRWVPLGTDASAYTAPVTRNGADYIPAGTSTKLFGPFATVGTTRYLVTLTPSFFYSGTWHTPAVFPTGYGYALSNKAEDSFSVAFYGIPTGGLAIEWQITVLAQDPVSTATP